MAARKTGQDQLSMFKDTLGDSTKMDIELTEESTTSLKENYSGNSLAAYLQRNMEIGQFKDLKVNGDEGPPRQAMVPSTVQIDNQRTIFQVNNEVANQPCRNSQDLVLSTCKKDEKVVAKVSTNWLLVAREEDEENQRTMNELRVKIGNEDTTPTLGDAYTNPTTEPKSVFLPVSSEDHSFQTEAGELLANKIEESKESKNIPATYSESCLSNGDNNQKRSSTANSQNATSNTSPLCHEERVQDGILVGAEETIHTLEAQRGDVKVQIQDSTMLCLIDGDDKENFSPIVLEDLSDKYQIVGDSQLALEFQTHKPEIPMMDIDKEPVFAEENLEKDIKVIMDDESLSKRETVEDRNCILEVEDLVINEVEEGEKDLRETRHLIHQASGEIKPEESKLCFQQKLQQPSYPPQQPLQVRHQFQTKDRQAATHALVTSTEKRQHLASDMKQSRQRSPFSNMKSAVQLNKRPPQIASLNSKKQARPPLVSKEKPKTCLKALASLKDHHSPLQRKTKGSNLLNESESKRLKTPKSCDKVFKSTAFPKLIHQTPIRKECIQNDSKFCTEIAARLEEAEQILFQKKPPIPNFSNILRFKSQKPEHEDKTEVSRKPPVPKLYDLLKKKPKIG